MQTPYIGLTDIASSEQVKHLLQYLPLDYRLHVGVMCSYKQLRGLPTKWADIWPTPEQIDEIFIDDPRVFNVIHYADFEMAAPTTFEDLALAIKRGGPNVHGIQLDMIWPNPELVRLLHDQFPTIEIILQVSATAMDVADDWVRETGYYKDIVDYILLDNGMGRGYQFNPIVFARKIESVLGLGFDVSQIAVAGGLGPITYKNLQPIMDLYPRISCDAQSRLRPEQDSMKPLDIVYAQAYVQGIAELVDGF